MNGCGRSINRQNLTGVCTHCQKGTQPKPRVRRSAQAYFSTHLIAETEDEFNVNQLWKSLGVNDKWLVLEIAMGAKR